MAAAINIISAHFCSLNLRCHQEGEHHAQSKLVKKKNSKNNFVCRRGINVILVKASWWYMAFFEL